MKKFIPAFIIMFAIMTFVTGCSKTTNTIDNSMTPYSDNFTVDAKDWVANGKGYLHGLDLSDMIDDNTLKYDIVVVYLSADNGRNYNMLNTTLWDNTNSKWVRYSATHGVDGNTHNVTLYAENTDNTQTARPITMIAKVVVAPAKSISSMNIDLRDYKAVKAAFNLKD